jgi:hypothetical protein
MAPASFHHTSNPVCVMDASGRLGSTIVLRLLQRGYTVHAAVQHHGQLKHHFFSSSSSSSSSSALSCFFFFPYILDDRSSDESQFSGLSCDHSKKLKIFRSDPFDYQSIIHALKGCSGLFYAFEPPQDQPTYDVSSFSFFTDCI